MSTLDNVKINNEDDDQIVTPWKVQSKSAINYMKLINQFGCEPIDGELIGDEEQN